MKKAELLTRGLRKEWNRPLKNFCKCFLDFFFHRCSSWRRESHKVRVCTCGHAHVSGGVQGYRDAGVQGYRHVSICILDPQAQPRKLLAVEGDQMETGGAQGKKPSSVRYKGSCRPWQNAHFHVPRQLSSFSCSIHLAQSRRTQRDTVAC